MHQSKNAHRKAITILLLMLLCYVHLRDLVYVSPSACSAWTPSWGNGASQCCRPGLSLTNSLSDHPLATFGKSGTSPRLYPKRSSNQQGLISFEASYLLMAPFPFTGASGKDPFLSSQRMRLTGRLNLVSRAGTGTLHYLLQGTWSGVYIQCFRISPKGGSTVVKQGRNHHSAD